ncbi:Smr domain protein [Hypoxylon crocopeplum]|nr:Smr domain protein [Hypoxylon crocopeplum]
MSSIPLTRVGGRAFNHSPSSDAEAEYDRLRDLARAEAAKRNSCFDRAHQAYERGDGGSAKELSTEGKRHAAKMDEYNKQASEYIFRENNAPGRVPDDTIDLHGQFVEEAEDILEQRIRYAQRTGQTHLHVIVGKGNHSTDHVQKLKPRVEQVCQELGLQYVTEDNAGRIYVNLQGGEAVMPPLPPAQHGGYEYQGGQQHHHGGQQHHGGQSQQQQEQPDEIERLVSKLVRKLGDCCVVM